MSQKPRTGAPARTPSTPKIVAKDEPMIEADAIVEPVTAGDPAVGFVEAEPAASADVVAEPTSPPIETIAEPPMADAVPILAAAPAIEPTHPPLMQGMTKMMKSTEDFMAFGQANVEAFVRSGQIWAAGVQELTKQMAACAKESFDESVSTFKAISTAKSVKEALDLQSTFAKTAFEKAMAESNKLTDASIKLTEQTLAPLTARMSDAVETFGKTV